MAQVYPVRTPAPGSTRPLATVVARMPAPRTPVEPTTTDAQRRNRLRRAAPLLVPLALVVLLLGPHLVGARTLSPADQLFAWQPWAAERPEDLTPTHRAPFSDNFDGVLPAREELVSRIRSGDWPLWTPLSGGGTDLATNIGTGAAAPSNVVAVLTPGWYTTTLLKALELLAAWGFVFLFLRRVGANRWAASFAGTVFAVSGFQVVWINWPHTRVAALVAGVLWAFDRVLERPDPGRIAVAAALIAATVLEGFPAVALVGIGAVALVLALRLAQQAQGLLDAARRAGAAALAAVLGAALTAVVMLPFASRLETNSIDRSVPADLPIARALGTVLAPNALGPAERFFGPLNYIEVVGYLGAVAVLVVVVGVVAALTRGRPDQRGWLLLVTAGGGATMLAFSYGVEPVYDLFRGLPVLSTNPAMRVKATAALLLALAGGLALDALMRTRLRGAARWVCVAVTLAATSGVVVYLWSFAHLADAELRDYVTGEVVRATVVTLLAAALLLVLVLRPPWPPATRVAAAGLIVVTVIDAAAFVIPYWPRSERDELYPVTEAHDFLEQRLDGERFGAYELTFFPGTSNYYGLRTTHGHLFHHPNWVDALEASGATMRSPTFSSFDDPRSATSPVLDRLATAYWADPAGLARCAEDDPAATELRQDDVLGLRLGALGPGVRGFTFSPTEQLPEDTELTVRATTADGSVLSSQRRLQGGVLPGQLVTVAVPGLELERGPLELELTSTEPLGTLDAPVICTAPDDQLELVHTSGAWIYQRRSALPRIRWAGASVVETDPQRRTELLASGTLDDDTVLLSEPGSTAGAQQPSAGSVESVVDTSDSLRIVVEADGPGHLVVADAKQSGWTATVDGEPTELVEADHAGVAVALDAGRHEVALRYEPPGLRAGALISALALAVTLALAAAGALRGRSRRRRLDDTDPPEAPQEPAGA